jgi:Asp-tRNA(Asn)/Glu-tRNA(Gln) amidotransferase A subunit family amidase
VFTSSAAHGALVAAHPDRLTPPLAAAAAMEPPTRADYEEAMVVVGRVRRQMSEWLDQFDVICSPTMATVAPPIPDGWEMPYADGHMGTNFTAMSNVCRQTAASYPCGLVDGLPVGLQVIGPGRSEAVVLRVCRALELAVPFQARPV